jgi:hypothetical protein
MKSKSLKPSGNSITLWISGQCWSSENHAWWSSPSKPLLKIQRPLTIDVPLYGSVADYSIVTPKSMQAWCLKTVYMSMWILHRPSLLLVAGSRLAAIWKSQPRNIVANFLCRGQLIHPIPWPPTVVQVCLS